MNLTWWQVTRSRVSNGPPPDYDGAKCITHPEPWLWDVDASIAKDKAKTKPAIEANKQVAHAKAICGLCPVIDVCLQVALLDEHGLSGRYRYGVKGGLDRYERADLPTEPVAPPGLEPQRQSIMSPFVIKAGRTTCTTCGARIDNTVAARVEHLTTPSRAKAAARAQARARSKDTTTTTKTGPTP